MKPTCWQCALIAVAPFTAAATASAAPPHTWAVEGKLHGKPKDGGQDAEDISGLACAPAEGVARVCLIADDENQATQIVILNEGRLLAGDAIRLSSDMFGGKPLELDAEGVAYADGFFYVTGSHGRPRQEDGRTPEEIAARAAASRHLYRIDLSQAEVDLATGKLGAPQAVVIKESAPLLAYFKAAPQLLAADVPLAEEGLTIEGLAVLGEILALGFRGPLADKDGIVLGLPLRALFNGEQGPGTPQLLGLGTDTSGHPRGIRELSAAGGGYIGIAGPVTDPADDKKYLIQRGDYAAFWWDGRSAPVLRELEGYGARVKPEAIVPLAFDAGKLRALLLFDGPRNGAPTVVEIDFSPS